MCEALWQPPAALGLQACTDTHPQLQAAAAGNPCHHAPAQSDAACTGSSCPQSCCVVVCVECRPQKLLALQRLPLGSSMLRPAGTTPMSRWAHQHVLLLGSSAAHRTFALYVSTPPLQHTRMHAGSTRGSAHSGQGDP